MAYLNLHWYSFDFADAHPDWEQLLSDARHTPAEPLYGSGTTLCINSGWRDWAFGLIREAMRTGIDGCFLDGPVVFLGHATARPVGALRAGVWIGHPVGRGLVELALEGLHRVREDSMARFLREAGEALREVNPEGVIFLNGGSWHSGAWRVARDIETMSPFEEFNGAEAFFHPGPRQHMLLAWAAAAKHLAAAGKPAIVFSHHCLGAWHYLPLPPVEAKLAAAQTVACGANPWIAVFDYSMDNAPEETLAPIREINGFLEGIEEYCTAAESGAEVALLYSAQSAMFYVSQVDDLFAETAAAQERDLGVDGGSGKRIADLARRKALCDQWQGRSYQGWFEALTREHIPFDVILDTALTDDGLARYGTVILPNATCMSDEQLAALIRFAEGDGSLVATFETGQYDERGNPRTVNPLHATLGIDGIAGAFAPATMEEYVAAVGGHAATGFAEGRWLARPVNCLKVAVTDATVPMRVLDPIGRVYEAPKGVSDWPGMVCRERGDGRTVYLPALVGAGYADYQIADHQRWMAAAVRWAHGRRMPLEVTAPGSVQVELWRQPGCRIVHLVNATGTASRPIAETVPVHDGQIRLPGPAPTSVRLASGGEADWRHDGNRTLITVRVLELYDLVIVED